jgi:rhamnogalacturonan endolyase
VKADANGKFTLPAVRPGSYTLYAWQTQGPITQSFAKDGIEVKGDTLDLGAVEWDAPHHPNLLFQVGQADRMAGEFKLGNAPRSNQNTNQVPSDLTFTVGQSKEATDWFYAQHSGTWTIKFNVAAVPAGNAYLTIPVAGGPGNVTVLVNGTEVGRIAKGDDASVRRAANRSGVYARYEFTFPASTLKPGENTVALQMPARGGRRGGAAPQEGEPTGQQPGSNANNGIMYDTVVLQTD